MAARLEALETSVPLKLWLSFKTHPVMPLAWAWFQSGRGVEVVSETELVSVLNLGVPPDHILVNGVAKHAWLGRYRQPGLRVHFDSLVEAEALLPIAGANRWKVGIRCHVPGEADARDRRHGGQFGCSRPEALAALDRIRAAGADLQSIHFHLGQGTRAPNACVTALTFVADLCNEAGFAPRVVDCGGGLPTALDTTSATEADAAFADVAAAIRLAPRLFKALEEIWLENGRFLTESSAVLAIRVLEVKEREDSRYLICDGGRTNHALAADTHPRPLVVPVNRTGRARPTTVCGPTCMTDDHLGRWELPEDIEAGDVLVWTDAGAYHLPWESRFSHGLCAVAWYDEEDRLSIAREREQPREWAARWMAAAHA
jgi:diaminopimelate decarboxylase